ncbi:sodium/proline symporter [Hyphococcus flavus]|uniref:Sodium/proline symporter n=1 Tax=Hyphococcus flavus TaxID=1866326 RepID=A0AAE9ZCT2_9PROT|nr:sodium/proline symporter [Hyphococcus flavus]WDI30077.1 sodium/proline symporter [Hyphococcus flavus]
MNGGAIILTVVISYLAAMLIVGIAARPRTSSKKEYYIAGRRLPYWVIAFSMNATGESAWLLLGLSGLAYAVGVNALWVVLGETLGIWLSWRFVAKRLNRAAIKSDAITVPDILSDKLGDPFHLLRIAAALIILAMVLVYVAAQMLATGKAFESFLGWPYAIGVIAGGFVTVLYTSFGGFRGVAYTDTAQALLMVFAITAVPIAGLIEAGGLGDVANSLKSINPALLAPVDLSSGMTIGLIALASSLAVGLPFMGVPQLLVRFMAVSGVEEIRKASRISVVVIFLLGLGAVCTGLVGRVLVPNLTDPETVMPTLSEDLFPSFVTGLLVAAVLSAVMSTVSSLMNLASSALVGDLYHQVLRPNADTRTLGRIGIGVTALVGVSGVLVALNQNSSIFDFVLFAWAGLGAAFGPMILCVLWWKRTTWIGALAGMIGGFATTVIWITFFKTQFYDLYEMIPGFAAGLMCTVCVSLITSKKQPVA